MVVEGESTHPDLIVRFYSAIPGPARITDQRIQWFDDVGIDNTVQRYIPGLLLCVLVALQCTQAEYDGLAVVHEPEYLKLTALWIGKSRGFRIVGDQVYRDWSKDFSDMPIYSSICEPLPLPFHHVVFSPSYKDRVKFATSKSRGHPARYWFELVSKEAVRFLNHYLDYHAITVRRYFLGIKQLLQKDPKFGEYRASAPMRGAQYFPMCSKIVGSAWQS